MNRDIARDLGLHVELDLAEDQNTYNEALQAMLIAPRKFPPGALNNRGPVDMRNPTAVSTLRDAAGDQLTLADNDDNQYHWAVVRTDSHEALHVLLLGGETVDFILQHHALTVASKLGLLTYIQPINLRDPKSAQVIREQLGTTAVIPPAGPHQYLVHANATPVLLDGPDVITFICDLWSLMHGALHEVWEYRFPVDLSQPSDRATLLEDLGETRGQLPPTTGLFHYVNLNLPGGAERKALIALGDGWCSMRMAIAYGSPHPHEDDLYPEGLLPL